MLSSWYDASAQWQHYGESAVKNMADDFRDILSPSGTGVRLSIKARAGARPGKSAERTPKIVQVAEGKRALEIAIAAPARDGKANQALLAFLAGELRLKKADLSIKAGTANRLKLIEITGNPQALYARVAGWLAGCGSE